MRLNRKTLLAAVLSFSGMQAAAAEADAPLHVANYDLTIAGVSIGEAVMRVHDASVESYEISMGLMFRFLFWSGEAEGASVGKIVESSPNPTAFDATFRGMSEPVVITTKFDQQGPTEWSITPPPKEKYLKERVPLDEADLIGAVDPISAAVIRAGTATEACDRTLRIFSGATRLNLILRPGVETEPGVHACEVTYVPVSGHRKTSESVARLQRSGPVLSIYQVSPGLWAPHRVGIPTSVGTLAITRVVPEKVN